MTFKRIVVLLSIVYAGMVSAGGAIIFDGEELEYSPGYRAIDIAPNHAYEACVALETGQALHIGFEAGAPLEFDVHFHRDGQVAFPVKPHATRGATATYRFDEARNYCLMWVNKGKQPALLEFGYDFEQ